MTENTIKKHTLYVMGGVAALLVLWASFGSKGSRNVVADAYDLEEVQTLETPDAASDIVEAGSVMPESQAEEKQVEQPAVEAESPEPESVNEGYGDVAMMLAPHRVRRASNPYEAHSDSMPGGGVKMKINYLGGTLGRVFNDSNYLHISTAEKVGIKPLGSLRDAWDAGSRLVRLESCREYYLDNLTHSLPYLVPEAHKLLTDIGAAFKDSLQARGGGDYRIKVTSVLRTPRLVKRLRRRNRNAIDTSAHLYGTTFDISYAKFISDSTRVPRTQEDLKNLLGEVVYAMRDNGRCYVKYERKQACFHITAR